jgi:HAD superfamily hydrolase (TIGR01509 family)
MRAVIFDMDGLLIDSEKVYWAVGRQMAKEFGKTVTDQTLGSMMGRAPLESIAIYARDLGLTQTPHELLEMRESRVLYAMRDGIDPMPGLVEALNLLKPLFKLAIATSAPGRFVDVAMQSLKIGGYFQAIQTSDDIVNGKPDPEIYLKAMAKLNMSPAECFVLEDSSNGSLAGKRAGAYVIAVPTEHTHWQDFSFVNYRAKNLVDAAQHVLKFAGESAVKQ